jgi:hypothetical protein
VISFQTLALAAVLVLGGRSVWPQGAVEDLEHDLKSGREAADDRNGRSGGAEPRHPASTQCENVAKSGDGSDWLSSN